MTVTRNLSDGRLPNVAVGQLRGRIHDIALATNDYATGGIAVTAANVGLNEIIGAVVLGQVATTTGYVPVWDQTAKKVMFFEQDAGGALAEVANGSSTAITVRLLVLGF